MERNNDIINLLNTVEKVLSSIDGTFKEVQTPKKAKKAKTKNDDIYKKYTIINLGISKLDKMKKDNLIINKVINRYQVLESYKNKQIYLMDIIKIKEMLEDFLYDASKLYNTITRTELTPYKERLREVILSVKEDLILLGVKIEDNMKKISTFPDFLDEVISYDSDIYYEENIEPKLMNSLHNLKYSAEVILKELKD